MTRQRPWKRVPREEATGRLRNARDYMRSAEDVLALTDKDGNGNPAMAHALLAVIGYADAITIKIGGVQNTQDHAQIVAALRHVLGAAADVKELNRLSKLVARKNDIQYDHPSASRTEAAAYMEQCRRFAAWAEITIGSA